MNGAVDCRLEQYTSHSRMVSDPFIHHKLTQSHSINLELFTLVKLKVRLHFILSDNIFNLTPSDQPLSVSIITMTGTVVLDVDRRHFFG